MRLDKLVKTVVDALEDIKGRDIVVIDVRKMTALFDKVIVVSGDSTRQNKALADNVQKKVKAIGGTVCGIEGTDPGEWVLVDLGDMAIIMLDFGPCAGCPTDLDGNGDINNDRDPVTRLFPARRHHVARGHDGR